MPSSRTAAIPSFEPHAALCLPSLDPPQIAAVKAHLAKEGVTFRHQASMAQNSLSEGEQVILARSLCE